MMDSIRITERNLEDEHICCALSDNQDPQVASKKAWMRDRFADGLTFVKSAQRGKCFIEYIPAEHAWVPVLAENYMFINCFWVSGAMKGHGYSTDLLNICIQDSRKRGKRGLCVISSKRKRAFLSDPKYLEHVGFRIADTAAPDFVLYYLTFEPDSLDSQDSNVPRFLPHAKHPHMDTSGYVMLYTSQCPFTAKYVPLLQRVAAEQGVLCTAIHLQSRQEARCAPVAVTTFALFYNGTYVTNEILSEKKFAAMIERNGT
ncbi:MAG: GNAT family N-acetyltransferase [Sphaerochaetaceae bacterium]